MCISVATRSAAVVETGLDHSRKSGAATVRIIHYHNHYRSVRTKMQAKVCRARLLVIGYKMC